MLYSQNEEIEIMASRFLQLLRMINNDSSFSTEDLSESESTCNYIYIRLGGIWSKLSEPKSSETTFAFWHKD